MGNLTYDFTGRSVIVTGAARGIGFELGAFFAGAGAQTYMVDVDADELRMRPSGPAGWLWWPMSAAPPTSRPPWRP